MVQAKFLNFMEHMIEHSYELGKLTRVVYSSHMVFILLEPVTLCVQVPYLKIIVYLINV